MKKKCGFFWGKTDQGRGLTVKKSWKSVILIENLFNHGLKYCACIHNSREVINVDL